MYTWGTSFRIKEVCCRLHLTPHPCLPRTLVRTCGKLQRGVQNNRCKKYIVVDKTRTLLRVRDGQFVATNELRTH